MKCVYMLEVINKTSLSSKTDEKYTHWGGNDLWWDLSVFLYIAVFPNNPPLFVCSAVERKTTKEN